MTNPCRPFNPGEVTHWEGPLPDLPPDYMWFIFAGSPTIRRRDAPLDMWSQTEHGWIEQDFGVSSTEITPVKWYAEAGRGGNYPLKSELFDDANDTLKLLAEWFWMGVV